MSRFLFIGSYAPQGAKALLTAGGSARRDALAKMLSGMGGRLESIDFGFGGDDVYVIAELPDSKTAAAVALTVSASGIAATRTVVLITPEEMDAVAELHPDYTPPAAS